MRITIPFCFLILSIFFVLHSKSLIHPYKYPFPFELQDISFQDKQYSFPYNPRKLNKNPNDTIYVAILDQHFFPNPSQCLMKNQWIDPFLTKEQIEGVEWYSFANYTNKNCSIRPITVSPPPKKTKIINIETYLLIETFKNYINRSKSGYLFLVGDSAFINVDKILQFFEDIRIGYPSPITTNFARGGCIEKRYFFHLFVYNCGLLISRAAVIEMLNSKIWEICIQITLPTEEVLGQIFDSVNVIVHSHQQGEFISAEFADPLSFQKLINKNFSNLIECKYTGLKWAFPGTVSSCDQSYHRINDIFGWHATIDGNETKFLELAPKIVNETPNNIGYVWNKDQIYLCEIKE